LTLTHAVVTDACRAADGRATPCDRPARVRNRLSPAGGGSECTEDNARSASRRARDRILSRRR